MKEISLIMIFLTIHINAFSQKKFSFPFSRYYNENATITLGIQYNYVLQSYQLGLKENWQKKYPIDYPNDNILYLGDLKSIHSNTSSGFSVGIPIDFKINQHIYINSSPSFLFINNLNVTYESLNNKYSALIRKSKHSISTTEGDNFHSIEIPIAIKLRSDEKILKNRINKYRGYIIGGIRYNKWIGINKEYKKNINDQTLNSNALILKPNFFSWDIGIGADIFFDGFKISPEIKFNQSLNNVFDNNNLLSKNNKFMAPIEKALIRNIYFGLILQ